MMKRILALILALCLLCGGALAEDDVAAIDALNETLELVLFGSYEDICAKLDETLIREADFSNLYRLYRSYGDVEEWSMTRAGRNAPYIVGEFTVTQSGVNYQYILTMNPDGKIAGLNVKTLPVEFRPMEIDPSINFQERVYEIMTLLLTGQYDQTAALLREEIATSASADTLRGLVEIIGAPELFALVNLQEQMGYHQAIFEVQQSQSLAQYQLTLDGNGRIAGLHVNNKFGERDNIDEKWESLARDAMELLFGGEYEAFLNVMHEDLRVHFSAWQLESISSTLGKAEAMQLHDLWQSDGYAFADFIVRHQLQEMLYHFTMSEDGVFYGFSLYPVVRIQR